MAKAPMKKGKLTVAPPWLADFPKSSSSATELNRGAKLAAETSVVTSLTSMNSRPLSSHVLAMSPQVMDTPCRKSPQTEHWHSSSVPFSSSSVAEQPQMISEKSKSRALFLTNSSSSDPSNSNSCEGASPPEGRQAKVHVHTEGFARHECRIA